MKAAGAIVVAIALFGCAHRDKVDAPPAAPVIETKIVVVPRECAEINVETLKPQERVEKAEGFIANSVDVAIARGKQIDVANERIENGNASLARLAEVLKKYKCIRVSR